jgi:hypothetical protein
MERNDLTVEEIKKLFEEERFEFLCSQKSISLPIINRIYHKMLLGIKFPEIKVSNNIIIDGHHRYLASKIALVELQKIYYTELNYLEAKSWNEMFIDETDWDTIEDIRTHILNDAQYNKISIEKLLSLLE